MKPYLILLLSLCLVATVDVLPVTAQPVKFPILLLVDDSNPSAVTFTATLADPLFASSDHTFLEGISLPEFFSSEITTLTAPVSVAGLTTFNQKTPYYDSTAIDFQSGGNFDLRLFTAGSSTTQTFTTTSPAFLGTAVVDLSAYADLLPSAGYSSAVYAGYSQSGNPVQLLGKFSVIPEPSQTALFVLGAITLFLFRGRGSSANYFIR